MDLDTAVAVMKQELKDHPEKLELERDVLEKYGKLFRYENIDNITAEEFSDFLDLKNNHHWTISRHKTNLTRDMDKLKKSLKILLDESIPIANRLKRLRDEKNPDHQKYLGEAYFSPILLVTHPEKYPVYNGTVRTALDKMHVAKLTSSVIWERYPEVQKIILNIAQKHNLSLWQMDWVWWKALGAKSYEELLTYIQSLMVMVENYQPIVLRKILLSESATREEIEDELKKYNPDSESKSMINTVLTVLQREKNNIIRKEDDEFVINSFNELSPEQIQKLVNACNKRIEEFESGKEILSSEPKIRKKALYVTNNFPDMLNEFQEIVQNKDKAYYLIGNWSPASLSSPDYPLHMYVQSKGKIVAIFTVLKILNYEEFDQIKNKMSYRVTQKPGDIDPPTAAFLELIETKILENPFPIGNLEQFNNGKNVDYFPQRVGYVVDTGIPTNRNSNEKTRFFIALGPWKNWEHTLNNLPFRWGVNPSSSSNVGVFNSLRLGDIVFYYANQDKPTPFSQRGLFGVGKVVRKYDEEKELYWPDEKLANRVIYKHRFEIDSRKLVHTDQEILPWIEGLPFTKGLNHIANQEILQKLIESTKRNWDIELEAPETRYWKISPGPIGEDWKNQLNNGEIGIHFLDFGDLSTFTEDEMQHQIKIAYGESEVAKRANTFGQIRDFMKIKEGDIIVANSGKSKVLGLGRVAGTYRYKKNAKHPHTYPVEWYDTTERDIPIQEGWMRTVAPLMKEKFEELMNNSNDTSNYYIITQNEDSRYDDIPGVQYAYDNDKSHYKNFLVGTNFIVQTKIEKQNYFVGYGKVGIIEKSQGRNPYGNNITKIIAKFSKYTEFMDKKVRTENINEKMLQLAFPNKGARNIPPAMLPITKEIYDEIINGKKLFEQEAPQVDYLTPEDFENFLNAVPKLEAFNQPGQKPPMSAKQFQLLFRILYGSALKIFDALNIRVTDLDLDNRIIRISDSTSKFPYATILPTDISYLKEYVSTLQKDDKLFDVHRATLWNYAKQIGNLAGLKIFRGKEERETEGMDLLIFRESRAMQMSFDGARDGLIRRKLRVDFSNAVLRYDQPTIEDLKEWELKNLEKLPEIMPQIETFDDEPLPIPTQKEMKAGFAKINEELLVPDEKIAEIVTSLASGRHVLLAGPIGTGKTRLAKIIPEIFWEKVGGYYSEDHTATADWNTQDVIGGIFPKMDNGSPTYDIQNGCVVETVSKNWSNGVNGGKRVQTVNSSRSSPYAGTWLTIDEFNRADIDKAFGQLFTSLRTRSLKIPTDEKGKSFKELRIPKDFRIIGTLNTADKHFLFQLSDALKSRFAYIEIDIPNRKDKDKEIYYAMKNALDELDLKDFSSLIALDHTNKKIDIKKSKPEFYQNVLYAYNFLDTVRVFKKLGTAILKLIYQNLLVGSKMNGSSKITLDNALSSNLVSQLENMSVAEIGAIRALNTNKVVEYFQEANANPNKQSFVDSLRKTLEYLVISNKDNLVSSFSKGNIKGNESDEWNIIKTAYDKKKPELQLELSKMEKSMNDLMKTLVI